MKELSIIHLMMILVGGILYQKNDHITVILLWHVLIMYADVYPWIFYYYFKNRWCAIPTTFPITTRRQSCNAIMVVLSNENLPKQIHTFSTLDKRISIPCIWCCFCGFMDRMSLQMAQKGNSIYEKTILNINSQLGCFFYIILFENRKMQGTLNSNQTKTFF